jgi:glycosyltransferase 2 family protein
MYMLLPDNPAIGFVALAVIFVSATLLGFASHSPGGLGVFDAAMLVGLWQYEREHVVAGLLLFRLLYYVVPFAIALVIVGTRELWLNALPSAPHSASSMTSQADSAEGKCNAQVGPSASSNSFTSPRMPI